VRTSVSHQFRTVDAFGDSLSMYLGTGHGRYALHNELEDVSHRIALLVGVSACQQPMNIFRPAINPGRHEAWHNAQRKAAKQHRGGIIFDLFIRAFSLPSRNAGFVDQGYDWKTIGMTPKYYGDSVARGHAADIRAAEVPMDCRSRRATRRTASLAVSSTCGTDLVPCQSCSGLCLRRSASSSGHGGSSRAASNSSRQTTIVLSRNCESRPLHVFFLPRKGHLVTEPTSISRSKLHVFLAF